MFDVPRAKWHKLFGWAFGISLGIVGYKNMTVGVCFVIISAIAWFLTHESARAVWANGTHSRKFVVCLTALAVLIGTTGGILVGRFVFPPPEHVDPLVHWAATPPNVASVIANTAAFKEDKGRYRLMLICRAGAADVDAMQDPDIAKSSAYEINGQFLTMQTPISQTILHRMALVQGQLDYYLVEIPSAITPEQIVTLHSLDAIGGKILSDKAAQFALGSGTAGGIALQPSEPRDQ